MAAKPGQAVVGKGMATSYRAGRGRKSRDPGFAAEVAEIAYQKCGQIEPPKRPRNAPKSLVSTSLSLSKSKIEGLPKLPYTRRKAPKSLASTSLSPSESPNNRQMLVGGLGAVA